MIYENELLKASLASFSKRNIVDDLQLPPSHLFLITYRQTACHNINQKDSSTCIREASTGLDTKLIEHHHHEPHNDHRAILDGEIKLQIEY